MQISQVIRGVILCQFLNIKYQIHVNMCSKYIVISNCVTVSVQEQLGKSFTVRMLILTRDYRRQSEYFFLLAGHLGFLTGCVRTWGEANSLEEVVASKRATRCYGCTNIASKRLKREVGGEIITWAIEKHFIKKIVVP